MEKLEAALGYAKRGWSVIPIKPRSKLPLVNWRDFEHRRASDNEIQRWWKSFPDAEIAVITGRISNIFVVDVDTYRGGNPRNVWDSHPSDLIVQTGRGGYHLYYQHSGEQVTTFAGENGIDVRGDGGYVIVPPSVHENGNAYAWVRTGTIGSSFAVDRNPAATSGSEPANEKWMEQALKGVGEGNRNDICSRLAGYFAGKGVSIGIAMVMLNEWNSKNKPPLPHEEIERTVKSIYNAQARTGGKKKAATPAVSTTFDLMPLTEYMIRFGAQPVLWDIDEWLPEQTVLFMVSPPGSFKTWMMLDLAASVATGTPFLGHFAVNNPGSVFVIQQEDFHGQTAERIGNIIYHRLGLRLPDNINDSEIVLPPEIPIYFHTERRLRFDDTVIMDALHYAIKSIRPKLVLIDPLYSAVDADNFMALAAQQMLPLKRMRDELGCSFVIIHHTTKGGEGTRREQLWGSQFLNALLESGWQIRPTETDNMVSVKRHFKAKGALPEIRLSFDISTDQPYVYRITPDTEQAFSSSSGDDMNQKVVQAIRTEPLSIKDLSTHLRQDRRIVTKRMQALERDGIVSLGGDGRYRLA